VFQVTVLAIEDQVQREPAPVHALQCRSWMADRDRAPVGSPGSVYGANIFKTVASITVLIQRRAWAEKGASWPGLWRLQVRGANPPGWDRSPVISSDWAAAIALGEFDEKAHISASMPALKQPTASLLNPSSNGKWSLRPLAIAWKLHSMVMSTGPPQDLLNSSSLETSVC